MTIDDIRSTFSGRRVLITGHTGFKGGWLSAWASTLGAEVTGLSLAPDQGPDNLFERADIASLCSATHLVDVRDQDSVRRVFADAKPEIVFHLAAQSIVRQAYRDPIETFKTNILGTAHVLEAARWTESVVATVCITTDKVYANNDWCWPYREIDRLGGIDPYSASKSSAEMVARVYMETLKPEDGRPYYLATARGGNVVGGGDWSAERIVPDIVRAIRSDRPLILRNPQAVRPWQHVLELCFGYFLLAHRMATERLNLDTAQSDFVGAWNFGPDPNNEIPVSQLVSNILMAWGRPGYPIEIEPSRLHESKYLRLDSSKARSVLGWRTVLGPAETIAWATRWYKAYLDEPNTAQNLIFSQVKDFESLIQQPLTEHQSV